MHRIHWSIYTILALVLINGCAAMLKAPSDDDARLVLHRMMAANEGLDQFKGLANIRMESEGRSQSGRIAFAAVTPDKMRIELLNAMGSPLTSLSADGERISVFSYVDQKRYRFRQSRTALEAIINIPIGIEDMQSLLAGKVPLPSYSFAKLMKGSTPNDILVLKNRWRGTVADLEVDRVDSRIKTLRKFDGDGELQYQIQWLQWKRVGAYRVPSRLVINTPSHERLIVNMGRFWPNAEVTPSTFLLDMQNK